MHATLAANYQPSVTISAVDPRDVAVQSPHSARCIVIRQPLNSVRSVSEFIAAVNAQLADTGVYIGSVETSEHRKQRILGEHPSVLRKIQYTLDFCLHRLLPKLPVTRTVYLKLTRGRLPVLSKAEALGRLVAAGFSIVTHREEGDLLHFVVQKNGAMVENGKTSLGPILCMKRVGQGGALIEVYKLRTMHPFAEYLQPYIYAQNHLHSSGKINNDFRITTVGRVLRKYWLDELPMLINWLKRDLKLVGVRPLSQHYLSLYPPSLAEERAQYKPGLIPPYYADLPADFNEVLESELRYLAAYRRSPLRTDLIYLIRALQNIMLRGARSS